MADMTTIARNQNPRIEAQTAWRFGVIVEPVVALPELMERIRMVEDLGFDQLYVPDHSSNLYDQEEHWLDGWSLLAATATLTDTIRIGTLVSNPILRAPAVVARQALTIDHLSGGRLDLGLGAGVMEFDHHAVGEEAWTPKVRARRFSEYVDIVDGLLRGTRQRYSYQGDYLSVRDIPTVPASIQRPRPPLLIGGQSPTVLRVTAEKADIWNTIGPIGVDYDAALEATARQNRQLDEMLTAAGRDPRSLRRSLTLFDSFDPWSSPVSFDDVVADYAAAGMTEFIIGWPPDDRLDELEHIASVSIPAMRSG